MDRLIEGFSKLRNEVLPRQRPLYKTLAREGQNAKHARDLVLRLARNA